jgi:hypothetical protein
LWLWLAVDERPDKGRVLMDFATEFPMEAVIDRAYVNAK